MSTDSSIDRDSFQTFLANSFAVQQSGLDAKSLSAVIEIQRFIGGGDFDLEKAMDMIAEHALTVSTASGIGIALLENGELVYRAGSGSAAKDVGVHVPAVLSVTSGRRPRREILRVEDAGSDTRIEAEICRQFGGLSLLMLPIYRDELLGGVLQVVCDQAHHFEDREIRTYHLMIAALEIGLYRHSAGVQTNEAAFEPISEIQVDSSENLRSIESTAAAMAVVAEAARQEPSESGPAFVQPGARAWVTYRTMLPPEHTTSWAALVGAIQKAITPPWSPDLRHSGAALGMAVALSLAVWIFHRDHSSATNVSFPATVARDANQAPGVSPTPEQDALTKLGQSKINPTGVKRFRRVRVGPNEVDEIAEDVTIRYFDVPTKSPVRSGTREVKFGKDVTVRYFREGPVSVSQPADALGNAPVQQTSFHSR